MAVNNAWQKEWQKVLKRLPPLHRAAWGGQNDQLLKALKKRADVNALDPQGYSALTGAAAEGHLETVRLLLDYGADPNLTGSSRNTPLMSAASFGYVDVVRLLLQRGAEVNARGFRGDHVLLRVGCVAEVAQSVRDERIRQVTHALVQAGAEVSVADSRGNTPLMRFVSLGYPEDLIRLLLEQGAEVNAKDSQGRTALRRAPRFGDAEDEVVALLLANGAIATNADGVSLIASRDASPAEVWNAYWARVLEDPFERSFAHVGMAQEILNRSLSLLRRRNARRLLLAGNGCSFLPHALAHLGFEVTVVDISPIANQVVAAVQPTPDLISQFLSEHRQRHDKQMGTVWVNDPEASLRRVAREATPGGSLTVVTADILNWESERAFDCIYDDRLAMLLPVESWPALAQQYRRLLTRNGLGIVETLNLGGGFGQDPSALRTTFEDAFTSAGLHKHRRDAAVDPPGHGPSVLFIHGSG